MRSILHYAVLACTIFFPVHGMCQIGDDISDSRVKTKLEALDLKYEITDEGNFKVVFAMEKKRSQLVIIKSKTYNYEGIEIREIFSVAAVANKKNEFTQSVLFSLLELNETYKLGAWQIDGGESPFVLEFSLKISANSTQSVLSEAIMLAAKVAEEMEQKLTGDDKH
jgi:hypothetical protein